MRLCTHIQYTVYCTVQSIFSSFCTTVHTTDYEASLVRIRYVDDTNEFAMTSAAILSAELINYLKHLRAPLEEGLSPFPVMSLARTLCFPHFMTCDKNDHLPRLTGLINCTDASERHFLFLWRSPGSQTHNPSLC